MRKLKTQLENCNIALEYWKETPPESVCPMLRSYKCGSLACFGGHLTTWLHFIYLGVTQVEDSYLPKMKLVDGSFIFGNDIAYELFGAGLFEQRSDDLDLDDHGYVTHIINERINQIKLEIEVLNRRYDNRFN